MLTIVRLSGDLAKKYGREFQFALDRPIDAIKALHCNFPDFAETLQALEAKGLSFRITAIGNRRREDLTLEDLGALHKPKVLRLAPVVTGGSQETRKANTQLAISAVLAVAAIVFSGGTAAPMLANAAIAFALSGATSHYAARQAKKNKREVKEQHPSAIYSSQENITEAGGPVPVGYGKLLIGSTVIGVSLDTHDIPMTATF